MVWVSANGSLAHCILPERAGVFPNSSQSHSSLLLPLIMSWQPLGQEVSSASTPTAAVTSSFSALRLSCPPFCPGSPWAGESEPLAANDSSPVLVGVPVSTMPNSSSSLPLRFGGGVLVPAWSTLSTGTLRLASAADVATALSASSGVQLIEPCAAALALPDTPSPTTGVCTNASDERSAACLYGEGDACHPCPEGALCPGGFRLWSRPGSFVATSAAVVAVPCPPPAEERCVGWDALAGTTQCGSAYRAGSFTCIGCAARHYLAMDGVCEPCPPLTGSGVLTVLAVLLAFVLGLAAFVGANYVAIRLIVKWRGGTVQGGLKRSVHLFMWIFGTLQLVAVVCSTAAPGLPPTVRGFMSMLSVFTFDSLVPAAPCLSGTPPLAMQLRVMALALAITVSWPLASMLAAWTGRQVSSDASVFPVVAENSKD